MFESKKIEDIKNKDLVDRQLREQGVATSITNNPRYQSVLSRVSYMLMHPEKRNDFSINVDSEGNIVLIQSSNKIPIMCMKYYVDKNDDNLKRAKIEFDTEGKENIKTISSYDLFGIEQGLLLIQNIGDERYMTRTTRLGNRPDVIKIERINQGKETQRLSDVYQSRIFWAAFEDINPDEIDIDPLETNPLAFLGKGGLPPTYVDLSLEEAAMIKNGIDIGLSKVDREDQFKLYRQTNRNFMRTTVFEEGVADMLGIDSRTIDEE